MKSTMTVKVSGGEGGYYAERTIAMRHVKSGLEAVLALIEGMPDQDENGKQYNWKKIEVIFERSE